MTRLVLLALAAAALLGCPSRAPPTPQLACTSPTPFSQWGQDAAHSGATCNQGQPLASILADLTYDPFVEQAKAEASGDLLAHYQAPLVDGDDAFMEWKSGVFVPCNPPGSGTPAPCASDAWSLQVWSEKKLHWTAGQLTEAWTFPSDWKPPPDGPSIGGWEPVFHAALSAGSVWVPGAGGSVFQVDRASGLLQKRHQPFGAALDPDTYVAGPLTLDRQGNVLYNAIKLDHGHPWTADAQGFLVRVRPSGQTEMVGFSALAVGAPAPTDQCQGTFPAPKKDEPALPPPDQDGHPVTPTAHFACLSQRPGINVAPAVGPDGTIFTVSRSHAGARYAYLLAVNPDLTPKWAASLRGLLSDGCGVLTPADGQYFNCAASAKKGVDPFTNDLPAGRVSDSGTASPVALPDGSVIYGALTTYNRSRGHLLKFSAAGKFLSSYDFGWDTTPAFFPHDGTYSIVIKDNHYFGGPYSITQLDANLRVEWSFNATNTQACTRQADGSMTCTSPPDNANGFEWCVNAPVVDRDGVVYANSEDGWLYSIAPGGILKQRLFLKLALGAAYTPLSIDGAGRIYTQNDGHLFVVGR